MKRSYSVPANYVDCGHAARRTRCCPSRSRKADIRDMRASNEIGAAVDRAKHACKVVLLSEAQEQRVVVHRVAHLRVIEGREAECVLRVEVVKLHVELAPRDKLAAHQ
jgi:hypothetical protein